MKKILFFTSILSFCLSHGQYLQTRILKVPPSKVEKFMSAAANKTKIYNTKEGQPRYLTFQILTGKYSQNFVRMQVASSLSEFDKEDKIGNAYWQKTTGSLHESEGGYLWSVARNFTYIPEDNKPLNHRRVIFYQYKDGYGSDFWRFRARVKKALEKINYNQRVSVLRCNSGCDGNIVQLRFHHKDFEDEATFSEIRPKIRAAYNEIYGSNSYEDDQSKMLESLTEINGKRIRHFKFLPALSSPRN